MMRGEEARVAMSVTIGICMECGGRTYGRVVVPCKRCGSQAIRAEEVSSTRGELGR